MKTKKQNNWGGNWTEQKLDAFEKYVESYLTIMIAQRKKYGNWPKRIIYFDGFAGSGSRSKETVSNIQHDQIELIDLDIQENETKLYRGSAERVVKLKKQFDEYYFVDSNYSALSSLKVKLQPYCSERCHYLEGNANNVLIEFSDNLTSSDVALILIDPFGMQINWASIAQFKEKKVDIWILVPSGVIVNRLLDKKGELKNIKTLEKFFGINEKEIREVFYKKEQACTLFGNEELLVKVSDAIKHIAILYANRLKTIWNYIIDRPLVLMNSKNVPIYHFIFASNNKTAVKIAKRIIESKE